jgi:hypothetical protein
VGVRERFLPARGAAPAVRDSQAEGVAAGAGHVRIGAAEPVAVAVHVRGRSAMGVAHLVTPTVANSRPHRPDSSPPQSHRHATAEHLRRERAPPQGQQPAPLGSLPPSPLVRRNHHHDPVPVPRIIVPRFRHPQQVPSPSPLISSPQNSDRPARNLAFWSYIGRLHSRMKGTKGKASSLMGKLTKKNPVESGQSR